MTEDNPYAYLNGSTCIPADDFADMMARNKEAVDSMKAAPELGEEEDFRDLADNIADAAFISLAEDVAKKKVTTIDNINHPAHYTAGKIETIEYIEDCGHGEGFCIGNAMKYLNRYPYKNGIEDLKKAVWYINRAIKTLEEQQ